MCKSILLFNLISKCCNFSEKMAYLLVISSPDYQQKIRQLLDDKSVPMFSYFLYIICVCDDGMMIIRPVLCD